MAVSPAGPPSTITAARYAVVEVVQRVVSSGSGLLVVEEVSGCLFNEQTARTTSGTENMEEWLV
jgi:hypothetical protein